MAASTARALLAGGVLAAVAASAVTVPAAASTSPATALRQTHLAATRVAADPPGAVVEASTDDKIRATQVLGIYADDTWLTYNDRDFVFAVWRVATENPEIRATAELALADGTAEAYVSFIQFGIYDAKKRDDEKTIRDATAAKNAREIKSGAAARIGIVADQEMLLLSYRDFVYELWKRASGTNVKAAALEAFGGTLEQQLAFLQTGIGVAHEKDLAEGIESETLRQARIDAAAVVGIVADETLLARDDDSFVLQLANAAVEGSEIETAALKALRTDDQAALRAFIATGIHEALKRDIAIALKKQADRYRADAQAILEVAERDRKKNLALAAKAALAGSDDDVVEFVRAGQYKVPVDVPTFGDFDGDDRGDVLTRRSGDKDVLHFHGTGNWFSAAEVIRTDVDAYDRFLRPGDFDGDGDADVLARNATSGALHLFRGDGKGGLIAGAPLTAGTSGWNRFDVILSPGDFDGDGAPDVLARNSSDKALLLYRGNGRGAFLGGAAPAVGPASWAAFDQLFSPGDFDGDGLPDLVGRGSSDKDIYLYRGDGKGGVAAGNKKIANQWEEFDRVLSVGDFDGDGASDLIGRGSSDKDIYLQRGDGKGALSTSRSKIGNSWGAFDILF